MPSCSRLTLTWRTSFWVSPAGLQRAQRERLLRGARGVRDRLAAQLRDRRDARLGKQVPRWHRSGWQTAIASTGRPDLAASEAGRSPMNPISIRCAANPASTSGPLSETTPPKGRKKVLRFVRKSRMLPLSAAWLALTLPCGYAMLKG